MSKLMLLLGAIATAGISHAYWPEDVPPPAARANAANEIAVYSAPVAMGQQQPQQQPPAGLTCTVIVNTLPTPVTATFPLAAGWLHFQTIYEGSGQAGPYRCFCRTLIGADGTRATWVAVFGLGSESVKGTAGDFGYVRFQVN
jgi:hypothetical protein